MKPTTCLCVVSRHVLSYGWPPCPLYAFVVWLWWLCLARGGDFTFTFVWYICESQVLMFENCSYYHFCEDVHKRLQTWQFLGLQVLLFPEEGWARSASSSYWTLTPAWWSHSRCKVVEVAGTRRWVFPLVEVSCRGFILYMTQSMEALASIAWDWSHNSRQKSLNAEVQKSFRTVFNL
jgi:hypothetical protein